jgi:hypothetical protein
MIPTETSTELATNAVLHVGEPYSVRALWRPPLFEVNVNDPFPAGAVHVRVDEQRSGPGGRGLSVIDRLARDWGLTIHDNSKPSGSTSSSPPPTHDPARSSHVAAASVKGRRASGRGRPRLRWGMVRTRLLERCCS